MHKIPFKIPLINLKYFSLFIFHSVLSYVLFSSLSCSLGTKLFLSSTENASLFLIPSFLFLLVCFLATTHHTTCRILIPWQGSNLYPAVEAKSLSHWSAREFLSYTFFYWRHTSYVPVVNGDSFLIISCSLITSISFVF